MYLVPVKETPAEYGFQTKSMQCRVLRVVIDLVAMRADGLKFAPKEMENPFDRLGPEPCMGKT